MNRINSTQTVRIGMVNYINTAPVYEPWKRRGTDPGWYVHEAPPSTLNRMLATGELDLGFVSCYEYAKHPKIYRILPDLSISANGPVGSVFLFAKTTVKELDGKLVLLSNQSETSVYLAKIALEEFYGIKPVYFSGEVTRDCVNDCEALLAIGDDALRLASTGEFTCQLDLGEIWKKHTGLPFVFAVCAVREEFCRENPQLLHEVHRRFIECREEGESRISDICKITAPRIPMEVSRCLEYLLGIEYNLGRTKLEALEKYFGYLIERGEAPVDALPLKIHSFAG